MGGSNWTSAWYTETFYWDQFPLWVSPRDSIRVTGSSPRSLVEGGQLPLMQIGAGWCFWHKVFILLFPSACSRMLRTPNPMPKQLDTSCTCKIRVQPEDFFDLVDFLLPYWAESSYHQPSETPVDGSRWIAQGFSQMISVPKHSTRNHGEIQINTPFLTLKTS